MLTGLNVYLPNGTELTYLEFEVHKDPIRTIRSDGIQYRIKLRGNNPLPEAVAHTGLVQLYDTESPYFWLKKCIRVSLKFNYKMVHNLYLLPMSIQVFSNNDIQMICMDISEKIMDLDINKSVLNIGTDTFTSYFKSRIEESNIYLNNSFDKAKKLISDQTRLKKINILVAAKGSEINRSNNTMISGTTMQLANYLLKQGWFKCPNYGIYDSFNLESIETDPNAYTMRYDFLNLGDLKDKTIKPKLLSQPMSVGDTKTLSQFFDTNLIDALKNKDATFDFIKGGGYDICIDDGSIHQNTNARIEMNVIAGSVENTKRKLCCLKQLVELNPQVYTASISGYLPLDFSIYSFNSETLVDLPIVINYLFKPMSVAETGKENFVVTTNFETLRVEKNQLNTKAYNDISINGENCSLIS